MQCDQVPLYSDFLNIDKDSKICYFLVFLAKISFPTTVMLSKSEGIKACHMFSNGTLPYKRSHVNTLNGENLTFGLRPSKTPRAPISAWFGATLNYERREYISDINEQNIKTDDQNEFHSIYWLNMNVGRNVGNFCWVKRHFPPQKVPIFLKMG